MLYFEARKIWAEAIRRFPSEKINFYAEAAEVLLENRTGIIEKMPYRARHCSEMFYLAGSLFEARGNADEAHNLFTRALKNDPTLKWPAYFAERKLKEMSKEQPQRHQDTK
jgi:hypothetical protein